MDTAPILAQNTLTIQHLPRVAGQHPLALPRIRAILVDACESAMLQLALWTLDGQLIISAGDEAGPHPSDDSAQHLIHSDDRIVATLIGRSSQPNLDQLVH